MLFFGHAQGIRKIPGQRFNKSHSSDRIESLTARPSGNSLKSFIILFLHLFQSYNLSGIYYCVCCKEDIEDIFLFYIDTHLAYSCIRHYLWKMPFFPEGVAICIHTHTHTFYMYISFLYIHLLLTYIRCLYLHEAISGLPILLHSI